MYSKSFCYKGKTILKSGRQNGRQKQGFLSKNSLFDRIKLSNMQKNRAFMLPNSHNYPILVRSTGIAPLAARPAKRLSIVCFAFRLMLSKWC